MTRHVRPFLFLATIGVASAVLGCGVGLFLGKDVQVWVSSDITEDDLRKIRTFVLDPRGYPPADFLSHFRAGLEKGRRFEVVKEEVISRFLAETKGGDWQERFAAAAKGAGADAFIKASLVLYSASAIRMRRAGGVAWATAELVSLAKPTTMMAQVRVEYQSPGAAIEDAGSALAEAIQEKIPRP